MVRSSRTSSLATSLASGFGSQAFLIVSGVAFARMLGPGDRGYLALLILWPSILWQFGSLGLPFAASYHIAKQPLDARGIAESLIKPAAIQTGALIALHVLVLVLFLQSRPPRLLGAGVVSLAYIPPALVWAYLLAVLQGQQRFVLLNIGRLLPALLTALGAVILSISSSHDLLAATAANVGALVVTGILLTILVARGLPKREPDAQRASPRRLLAFGLRALLGSVYPAETFRLDQVFAGLALSPTALGLYVVAGSFTNLPRFAALSIGMVSYPTVAAQPTAYLRRASLWRFFWITIVLSAAIVVALLGTVSVLVPLFFGRNFDAAIPAAQILLVGGVFLAARRGLSEGLKGAGFPLAGSVSEIASWFVLLPAMLLLAPTWNINGVAAAVTASSIFSLLVVLTSYLLLRGTGAWTEDVISPTPRVLDAASQANPSGHTS